MRIIRFPDVPRYIYAGRMGEQYLDDFINLYRSGQDEYPKEFFKTPPMRQMATRIAYVFFADLERQMIRDRSNKQYISLPFQKYGDPGFSWPVIRSALSSESVVLCAGIGGNMTFEAQLAFETNCLVHLFDPSEHAIRHFDSNYSHRSDLRLNKVGLWESTGTLSFYKDSDPSVGSLSPVNLMHSDMSFQLPVISLGDYIDSLKVEKIDYLKMDIEGAEYKVVEMLLQTGIQVDQLAFEFDQPVPPWRSLKLINKLVNGGFMPIHFWGTNGFFVHRNLALSQGYFESLIEE